MSLVCFCLVHQQEKEMKRKQMAAPRERNQFVAAALFRKAGAHCKSNKAIRRKQKMDDLKGFVV